MPPTRADAAWALAAGLATLALYLTTLQPDFGGPEDTPKFQFLGYVLGTAHPPGYPLYVWLSHFFVMLPVGTIAYRANLFSAVMASLSCAVVFVIARQIGARRWAAICAALALGAGASFWRSAVFAEVYTLGAAAAALTMTLLLAWSARPTPMRLLAATAAFALGLGNHLTIVGIAPACALHVLLRHRRAVTLKLVAACAVVLAVGVAQYGLIVVRTSQGAPYLESRASSVMDLPGVITAERFAGQRFAFGPWVLLTDHLPAVASLIGRELGVPGLLLFAAGLFSVARARNSGAALLAGSAAGMLGMVLNISGDLGGFITPVMALLWPLAALGADGVAQALRSMRVVRPVAAAIAMAAAAAMPLTNVAANYREADQSDETGPSRFFRSAFSQLPDRAGIVVEDYFYDMALHYMMFTGEGGPRRGIARIGFDAGEVRAAAHGTGAASGGPRRVFAFGGGALFLGTEGLQFQRYSISGPVLADWLLTLPKHSIVVGATAYVPGPIALSGPEHSHARLPGRPRTFEAFALRTGTTDARWRGGDDEASLTVDPAAMASMPAFAGTLVASAGAGGARIALGGQDIASVDTGLALAVFSPDGRLMRAEAYPGSDAVRVPFQEALYELTGDAPCVELGTGEWRDIAPALVTGSWIATLRTIGSVVVETTIAPESAGVRAQSTQLMGDGATGTSAAGGAGARFDTVVTRSSERRPVFRFSMDRPAVHAHARLKPGGAASSLAVCSHQPARPLFAAGAPAGMLKADFESEAYFGAGWSGAERNEAGPLRRGGERATLLLPLPPSFAYRVWLDIRAPGGAGVAISVNGRLAGTCDPSGNVGCTVTLPADLVREPITPLTIERTDRRVPHGPALIFRGARLERLSADGAPLS